MRISDWSSDVCSSDLARRQRPVPHGTHRRDRPEARRARPRIRHGDRAQAALRLVRRGAGSAGGEDIGHARHRADQARRRSEEHTSELQSLMRISYAVFCLKKKKTTNRTKYYEKREIRKMKNT